MNFKISWARVFIATQFLSIALFIFLAWYVLPDWIQPRSANAIDSPSKKTEVKLLPQLHLSNADDCADLVVIEICDGRVCSHHVESFHVLCKEISGQD